MVLKRPDVEALVYLESLQLQWRAVHAGARPPGPQTGPPGHRAEPDEQGRESVHADPGYVGVTLQILLYCCNSFSQPLRLN